MHPGCYLSEPAIMSDHLIACLLDRRVQSLKLLKYLSERLFKKVPPNKQQYCDKSPVRP